MLLLIAALQAVGIIAVLLLFLRKPAAPVLDPRLSQLPEDVSELRTRLAMLDNTLRSGFSDLLTKQGEAADRHRGSAEASAKLLRSEVEERIERLGAALTAELQNFRSDNADGARKLSSEVNTALREIEGKFSAFRNDTQKEHAVARDVLHGKLNELIDKNQAKLNEFSDKNQNSHDALREGVQSKLSGLGDAVQQRLDKLNQDNAQKLDQMRATVDEKLQSTLNERITTSFGQVTEHLGQVQKGLGEMREFATGVNDLKKVFSSVRARGSVGEFQLDMQLKQMFSPEQYVCNAQIKKGSSERVEFALRIPTGDTVSLLAIDSKFPLASWERLENAREHGNTAEQEAASRDFEKAIRNEGKSICAKYIDPPTTVPFGIMFLPTEALYAEVIRRPGLQAALHAECNVMVTGPSNLLALFTSLQFGFRTLAIQKKGNEVWNVLGRAKTEFQNFEKLIDKAEDNVEKVQKTFGEIGVRTRAINRNLRTVSELPLPEENSALIAAESFAAASLLASESEV